MKRNPLPGANPSPVSILSVCLTLYLEADGSTAVKV